MADGGAGQGQKPEARRGRRGASRSPRFHFPRRRRDHAAAAQQAPTPAEEREAATAKFVDESTNLASARSAVDDAASTSIGLWISYLFFLFYLLIAVGAVTHRDLLLENSVKLPVLGVELPLVAFFWLAPVLFVILHGYVLVHFALLAGKIGEFDRALKLEVPHPIEQAEVRRRLPNNVFVQFLAGPPETQKGLLAPLLRAIADITMGIAPVLLLLFFQAQFLAYHLESVTWIQRITLLVDLALLWTLWPAIRAGQARPSMALSNPLRRKFAALGSIVALLLALWVANFPGERVYGAFVAPSAAALTPPSAPPLWTAPRRLLFEGEVDRTHGRRASPFSNTLVVADNDVIDDSKFDSQAKLDAVQRTLSFRRRDLLQAVLIGSDLRKADFTGADLRWADFSHSDLREARFGCFLDDNANVAASAPDRCVKLGGAILVKAEIERAQFDNADLAGANMIGAQGDGASLASAHMQSANLQGASLQGAELAGADLTGARLNLAALDGADLADAKLIGAYLFNAQLRGANLKFADLTAVELLNAHLEGAFLDQAKLTAAHVFGAHFEGASLNGADLYAVSFDSASLRASSISDGAHLWRAKAPKAADQKIMIGAPGASHYRDPEFSPISQTTYDAYRDILKALPASQDNPLTRLETADPKGSASESPSAFVCPGAHQDWCAVKAHEPDPKLFAAELSRQLRKTGCDEAGAPHVVRGLLRQLLSSLPQAPRDSAAAVVLQSRLADIGELGPPLLDEFLDDNQCAGARGLGPEERAHMADLKRRMNEILTHTAAN